VTSPALRYAGWRRMIPPGGAPPVDPTDPEPTPTPDPVIDPTAIPAPPTLDLSAISGFTLAAWTNFPKNCTEGHFADNDMYGSSTGQGSATTDLNTLKWTGYTESFLDTRKNHKDSAGNANMGAVTLTGLVIAGGGTVANDPSNRFQTRHTGRLLAGTGVPPWTTVTYVNSGQVTLSQAVPVGTLAGAKLMEDYGHYSLKYTSVSGNILRARIFTGQDNIHYGWAGEPLLPGPSVNGGTDGPTLFKRGGMYDVWYFIDPGAVGYKQAWLWWPKSNHSTSATTAPSPPGLGTGGDGEIDFPECDIDGAHNIGGFMHWQDGGSDRPQTSAGDSKVKPTGRVWKHARVIWLPKNDRYSSRLEYYIDAGLGGGLVLVKDFNPSRSSGFNVPSQLMRWVLQTETRLGSYDTPIDPTQKATLYIGGVVFRRRNDNP
jgi:hypothetical protein